MSQHTVAASCACSSSTAGSSCVAWVGASSCLFMIDLTGPVCPARTHNSRPGIWHEPDARHDLNPLKLHLLLDSSVRSVWGSRTSDLWTSGWDRHDAGT